MSQASTPPSPRIVLLGASNLTRGFSTVLQATQHLHGAPLRIFTALGHGRSYGISSTLGLRTLPGITGCGLWKALEASSPGPTFALITDVGNDILYGVPLQAITGWVEECLSRLSVWKARTVLTLLPESSLLGLGPLRFALFRTILFPRSRLRLDAVGPLVQALNSGLTSLAARFAAEIVAPAPEWYGFDPIHFRSRSKAAAWGRFLAPWGGIGGESGGIGGESAGHAGSRPAEPLQRLAGPRSPKLRADAVRILGVELRHTQPCARLATGTEISVY